MTETSPVNTDMKQERNWAMFCHLSALAGFVGIPFGNVIGPLIIWLIKKDEIAAVDEHGKESLNFQITMSIAGVIAALFIFIFIGIALVLVVAVVDLIFIIIASVKTSNGEPYRYPFALRLVK